MKRDSRVSAAQALSKALPPPRRSPYQRAIPAPDGRSRHRLLVGPAGQHLGRCRDGDLLFPAQDRAHRADDLQDGGTATGRTCRQRSKPCSLNRMSEKPAAVQSAWNAGKSSQRSTANCAPFWNGRSDKPSQGCQNEKPAALATGLSVSMVAGARNYRYRHSLEIAV